MFCIWGEAMILNVAYFLGNFHELGDYRSTIACSFNNNSKKNKIIMKLWSHKNKNRINYFLQSFGVSKPFKVIFTDLFLLKKRKVRNSLRGEPYFFKINKYIVSRCTNHLWCYGSVEWVLGNTDFSTCNFHVGISGRVRMWCQDGFSFDSSICRKCGQ